VAAAMILAALIAVLSVVSAVKQYSHDYSFTFTGSLSSHSGFWIAFFKHSVSPSTARRHTSSTRLAVHCWPVRSTSRTQGRRRAQILPRSCCDGLVRCLEPVHARYVEVLTATTSAGTLQGDLRSRS